MPNLLKNKVLWLIVAVVVVGGGIWFATKGDEPKSVNKEVQSKCMTDVNDELFCKFAGAFGNVSAYTVSATSTSADQGTSSFSIASDSKDNTQMIIKQNDQEQASVVVYNGVTYLKDYTDGQWFKYSSDDPNKPEVTDLKKEFAKGDFKADNGQKIDYIKIGTEACDSMQCYKYQVKDPTTPSQEGFIWFDTKDYLLRRVTIKDSGSNTDMSVNYAAVNIAQPSPTKDLPSVDTLQ